MSSKLFSVVVVISVAMIMFDVVDLFLIIASSNNIYCDWSVYQTTTITAIK